MTHANRGDCAGSGLTYQQSGVDIDRKTGLLADLAATIASTYSPALAAGTGAFAGVIRLPGDAAMLAATVDGVGTKTLIARALDRDAVIGGDIVAHCANDLVATGATPMAFLDYIAMGALQPAVVRSLVEAMAAACRELGVVLLGGETAEMPGVYAGDAYDVVGIMIGLVGSDHLLTGETIRPGHRLVGLASTGLHTNGYSLARRVIEQARVSLDELMPALGTTVGEAVLRPHRCYAQAIHRLRGTVRLHGAVHITGGGIRDNLVRVLPHGCLALVAQSWPRPPIFTWLQQTGRIPDDDMLRTFNVGIGMIVVVEPHDVETVIRVCASVEIPAVEIGEILAGPRGVELR